MRRALALCGLLIASWETGATNTDGQQASNTTSDHTQERSYYNNNYNSNNYNNPYNYNSNNNNNNNNYNNNYLRPSSPGNSRSNYKYLSACIGPFRGYIAKDSGFYRVPSGQVFVVFDGGRGGKFNELTGGNYPGLDPKLEFTVQYDLNGLQDDCRHCKISIHKGQTCDAPLTRYWNDRVPGAYNPWKQRYGAYYTSDHSGKAKGHFGMFDGYNFDDHKQRTVVVFAKDGITRIGCGVLRKGDIGLCIGPSTGGQVTQQPQPPNTVSPAPVSKPPHRPTTSTIIPSTISPAPITPQPFMGASSAPSPAGTAAITSSPTFTPISRPTRPPRPPAPPPSMVPPTWVNPPSKGPRPTKSKVMNPSSKGAPGPTNSKAVNPSPKGNNVPIQTRMEPPPPPKEATKSSASKKDGGPKGGESGGPGPKT